MTSEAMSGPWSSWGRGAPFDPARLRAFFDMVSSLAEGGARDCGPSSVRADRERHRRDHHDHDDRTSRATHGGGRGGHGHGPGGRRGGPRAGAWPFGGFPGPGFGGPGFGGPGGFGRGPKVGRGDVREALLALLAEEPMHGYQMIRELSDRSGGMWRPSPGSVYPVLSLLTDEGLVRAEETEGKRVFHLTDAGRAHVVSREGEAKPWETAAAAANDELTSLRSLAFAVGAAIVQVAQAGDEEQIASARTLLADTRRSLYRILAGDTVGEPGSAPEGAAGPAANDGAVPPREDGDEPGDGASGPGGAKSL